MNNLKKIITTITEDFFIENRLRNINEGYDDVSMEYIKNKKKLSDYQNYNDKTTINNNTYLNFIDKHSNWFLEGQIIVFDSDDGTEIANATYGKINEHSDMKAAVDVRNDKRRMGIASNIYQWIEKLTGYKLSPDVPHSKSAEKFWNNPNRKFGFDR